MISCSCTTPKPKKKFRTCPKRVRKFRSWRKNIFFLQRRRTARDAGSGSTPPANWSGSSFPQPATPPFATTMIPLITKLSMIGLGDGLSLRIGRSIILLRNPLGRSEVLRRPWRVWATLAGSTLPTPSPHWILLGGGDCSTRKIQILPGSILWKLSTDESVKNAGQSARKCWGCLPTSRARARKEARFSNLPNPPAMWPNASGSSSCCRVRAAWQLFPP